VLNVAAVDKLNVSPTAIPLVAYAVSVIKKSFLAVDNALPYVAVAAEVAVIVELFPVPATVVALAAPLIIILAYAVLAIVQ
jgi:hypothetical protein